MRKKSGSDGHTLWGIDLGGTKIEGAIIRSGKYQEVLYRERIPTEAHGGYPHILEQVRKMVDMMTTHAGVKADRIGFSTPGTLDPSSGTMKNCNTVVMNGQPMKADLEKLLQAKVEIANDADCFALAEARYGVVQEQFPGARVVFGVILGTGVGGGIVVDGRPIVGLQGIAGEWGHNFLDESGGPCYCGKVGCVEKVISGPALEAYYFNETGNKRSLKDIVALASSKVDPTAQRTMSRLTDFFGRALSVIINILDPDVIVVGGGVGNIDYLYQQGVDVLRSHVFNTRLDTPIVRPKLGDSAGVIGAGLLLAEPF